MAGTSAFISTLCFRHHWRQFFFGSATKVNLLRSSRVIKFSRKTSNSFFLSASKNFSVFVLLEVSPSILIFDLLEVSPSILILYSLIEIDFMFSSVSAAQSAIAWSSIKSFGDMFSSTPSCTSVLRCCHHFCQSCFGSTIILNLSRLSAASRLRYETFNPLSLIVSKNFRVFVLPEVSPFMLMFLSVIEIESMFKSTSAAQLLITMSNITSFSGNMVSSIPCRTSGPTFAVIISSVKTGSGSSILTCILVLFPGRSETFSNVIHCKGWI